MCCIRLRNWILNRAFRAVTTSDIPSIELNDEVQAELAQYDHTTADLRDCRNKVQNEEEQEPDASRLVVANGSVSRADKTAIDKCAHEHWQNTLRLHL